MSMRVMEVVEEGEEEWEGEALRESVGSGDWLTLGQGVEVREEVEVGVEVGVALEEAVVFPLWVAELVAVRV